MKVEEVEEFILDTLRDISLNQELTVNCFINDDVDIDSIGWLRCLIQLEKKYNCTFNPLFIIDDKLVTIQDFIDKVIAYLKKINKVE